MQEAEVNESFSHEPFYPLNSAEQKSVLKMLFYDLAVREREAQHIKSCICKLSESFE